MDELRQPTTPLGVVNETLDATIIINENRGEADYHNVRGSNSVLGQIRVLIFELLPLLNSTLLYVSPTILPMLYES